MPGPPLPWMMLVVFFAQSLASALMVHSGHAALLRRPRGSLGHPVLFAEDVVLELVEAVGMGGDVLLVVGPLGQPDMGDRQV